MNYHRNSDPFLFIKIILLLINIDELLINGN